MLGVEGEGEDAVDGGRAHSSRPVSGSHHPDEDEGGVESAVIWFKLHAAVKATRETTGSDGVRTRERYASARGLSTEARQKLVAQQPGQIAYSIIDPKAVGRFMPPVFPGVTANSLPDLARRIGLPET